MQKYRRNIHKIVTAFLKFKILSSYSAAKGTFRPLSIFIKITQKIIHQPKCV